MKKFLILGDGIVSHLVANVLSNFGHKSFLLKSKGTKKLSKINRYFHSIFYRNIFISYGILVAIKRLFLIAKLKHGTMRHTKN